MKDFHLSMFQKLRQSDRCNLLQSCSKHGKPEKSHEKTLVPLNLLDKRAISKSERKDIDSKGRTEI